MNRDVLSLFDHVWRQVRKTPETSNQLSALGSSGLGGEAQVPQDWKSRVALPYFENITTSMEYVNFICERMFTEYLATELMIFILCIYDHISQISCHHLSICFCQEWLDADAAKEADDLAVELAAKEVKRSHRSFEDVANMDTDDAVAWRNISCLRKKNIETTNITNI